MRIMSESLQRCRQSCRMAVEEVWALCAVRVGWIGRAITGPRNNVGWSFLLRLISCESAFLN